MAISEDFKLNMELGELNMHEIDGGRHYVWCPACDKPEKLVFSDKNGIGFACGFLEKVRGA